MIRVRSLLPHVPVALLVLASGLLNLESALHHAAPIIGPVPGTELSGLNGSLNILGRGTQGALGLGLALLAIGLVLRLRAGWAFSLLIAIITVAVNLVRHEYGASLVLPGLILVSLLVWRDAFDRRTAYANVVLATIGIAAVLAYGLVGSQLLGAGFRPPIGDPITALYYTVVTLSTVGYGDVVPVTWHTRLFAMSLIVGGIGIFATSVASLLGPAIGGELNRIFAPQRRAMEHQYQVIVVGNGGTADSIARELAARDVDYVRIITAPSGDEREDERVIVGDPTEETVLRRAGIAAARTIVAAREDDSENAFVSLLAKDLNPHIRVLAIAATARGMRRLKLARADVAFAPTVVGGRLVANLVQGRGIPDDFADLLEGDGAAQ